jgi:hypothetical protein
MIKVIMHQLVRAVPHLICGKTIIEERVTGRRN